MLKFLKKDYFKRNLQYHMLVYKEKMEVSGIFPSACGLQLFQYEAQWKKLKKKYDQINIIGMQFVSIGETIPRLFRALYDMEKNTENVLYVILPTFRDVYIGGIYNTRLLGLFAKKMCIIDEHNYYFWWYIFNVHPRKINTKGFYRYVKRRAGKFDVELGKQWLEFSNSEVDEGEAKLKELGIKGDFVCIHARENKVKEKNFVRKLARSVGHCRDCDINTYSKACEYLENCGLQIVRIGKYENRACNIPGVIDYANCFHDDFMDFYLLAKSKFIIGSSGVAYMAPFWGTPLLATNVISLVYGYESFASTGYDMFILKKFWTVKEKRYLNLYEMLDIMNWCDEYSDRYVKKGIILEDNTEEEILKAAREMHERIEGEWEVTMEEEQIRNKFWKIMGEWKKKNKIPERKEFSGYTSAFHEISYTFLRDNLYLLDVDSLLLQ